MNFKGVGKHVAFGMDHISLGIRGSSIAFEMEGF